MNRKQRKEKKAQQRKVTAKQRVLARREQTRTRVKKENEARLAEQKYEQKLRPIRRGQGPSIEIETLEAPALEQPVEESVTGFTPSFREIKDKMIIERLEHNQEILKAIEEEYRQERETREKAKENIDEIIDQATIKLPAENT